MERAGLLLAGAQPPRRGAGRRRGIAGGFRARARRIESLPGLGRSTAAAIAAFAFGEREAILDGNVKRVLARHFAVAGYPGEPRVAKRLWALAEASFRRRTSRPIPRD